MGRTRSSRRVLRLGLEWTGGRPLLQPRLGFTPHIGLIDSACLKKRILRSSGLLSRQRGWRRGHRRKRTRALENPRLTGRSCGAFPCIGRLWASRLPRAGAYSVSSDRRCIQSVPSRRWPEPAAAFQTGGAFFRSKFLFQSLPRLALRCLGWLCAFAGAAGIGFAQAFTVK